MYSVYRADHIVGIGSAIVIVACGEESGSQFAEHHILLPHLRPGDLMSRRYSAQQKLSEELLRQFALEGASNELQHYVDEQCLKNRDGYFPPVKLTDADDGALHAVRYAGVCESQLSAIATKTYCGELKTAIHRLNGLPTIQAWPID